MDQIFTSHAATGQPFGRQRNILPLSLQKKHHSTPIIVSSPFLNMRDLFFQEQKSTNSLEKTSSSPTPTRIMGESVTEQLLPPQRSTDVVHSTSHLPLDPRLTVSPLIGEDSITPLKKDSVNMKGVEAYNHGEEGENYGERAREFLQHPEEKEEEESRNKKRTRGLPKEEETTRVWMIHKAHAAAGAECSVQDKEEQWGEKDDGGDIQKKDEPFSITRTVDRRQKDESTEDNYKSKKSNYLGTPQNHHEESSVLFPERALHSPASKRYRISTGAVPLGKTPCSDLPFTVFDESHDEVSAEGISGTSSLPLSYASKPVEEDHSIAQLPSSHIQAMYKNLEHLGKEWEDVCASAASAGRQGLHSRSRRTFSYTSSSGSSHPHEKSAETKPLTLEVEKVNRQDETDKGVPSKSGFPIDEEEVGVEEEGEKSIKTVNTGEEERENIKRKYHVYHADIKECSINSSLPLLQEEHIERTTPLQSCRRSMEKTHKDGKEEQVMKKEDEMWNSSAVWDGSRLSEESFPTPYRQHKDGKRRIVGPSQGGEENFEGKRIGGVYGSGGNGKASALPPSPQKRENRDTLPTSQEEKMLLSSAYFSAKERGVDSHSFLHSNAASFGAKSAARPREGEANTSRGCAPADEGTSSLPVQSSFTPSDLPSTLPLSASSAITTKKAPRHNPSHSWSSNMYSSSSLRPPPPPLLLSSSFSSGSAEGGDNKRGLLLFGQGTSLGNGPPSSLPLTPALAASERETEGGGAFTASARIITAPLKAASSLSTSPTLLASHPTGPPSGTTAPPPSSSASFQTPNSSLPKRTRDGRIKVVVRKRPLMPGELGIDCVRVASPQITLEVTKQRVDLSAYQQRSEFSFDAVFSEEEHNEAVYKNCTQELLELAIEGGSASCFAYGQTGSGKTHTMIGSEEEKGLYLMAVSDLFKRMSSSQRLSASFYEIYCNSLFDLLNGRAPVVLREGGDRRVNICGLTWHPVSSPEVLWEMVSAGMEQRRTGSTGANEQSSRSHAILSIRITNTESTEFQGVMNFVDLAGSERAADTATTDKQTRLEGAEINKSLLALKECIRALDEHRKHVPFRGSRLTEVLRDSFTGNSKTVMITNISPSSTNFEHTANTLRYAFRVKGLSIPTVAPDRARNAPRPFVPRVASYSRFRSGEAHSCSFRGAADEPGVTSPSRMMTAASLQGQHFPSMKVGHHKRYAYSTVSSNARQHLPSPTSHGSSSSMMRRGEGREERGEEFGGRDLRRWQPHPADPLASEYSEGVSLREKGKGQRSELLRPSQEDLLGRYISLTSGSGDGAGGDGEGDRKGDACSGTTSSVSSVRAPQRRVRKLSTSSGEVMDTSSALDSTASRLSLSNHHYLSRHKGGRRETAGEMEEEERKPRRRHRHHAEHSTNDLLHMIFSKKKKDTRNYREDSEEGDGKMGSEEYTELFGSSVGPPFSSGNEEEESELEELKQRLLRRVIRKVQRDLGREIQFILDERDQIISDLRQENEALRQNIEAIRGNDSSSETSSSTYGARAGGATPTTSPTVQAPSPLGSSAHGIEHKISSSHGVSPSFSSPSIPLPPPALKQPTPLHLRPLSSQRPPAARDSRISSTSSTPLKKPSARSSHYAVNQNDDQILSETIEDEI